MSSGPSLPKENPRSAWSICGEDTPRSRTTTSTLFEAQTGGSGSPPCRRRPRGAPPAPANCSLRFWFHTQRPRGSRSRPMIAAVRLLRVRIPRAYPPPAKGAINHPVPRQQPEPPQRSPRAGMTGSCACGVSISSGGTANIAVGGRLLKTAGRSLCNFLGSLQKMRSA